MSNRYENVDPSSVFNIIKLDLIDQAMVLRGHCEHEPSGEQNKLKLCKHCREGFSSRVEQAFAWNATAREMDQAILIEGGWICDWTNPKVPEIWKDIMWTVIQATPHLRWLLLADSDEDLHALLPADWGNGYDNIGLGVRVTNRQHAIHRLDQLRRIPVHVRFAEFGVPEEDLGKFNTKEIDLCRFNFPDGYQLSREQHRWVRKIENLF